MLGAFDEDGLVGDPLFLTIAQAFGDEMPPAVAMDQLGNFVMVWQASDGDGQGIYARNYDNEGTPIDDSFTVNQVIDYDQVSPTVSMNQSGQFVVAWVSDHNVMNNLNDTDRNSCVSHHSRSCVLPKACFSIG